LDSSVHFSRIYSVAEGIKNGVFPVKVHNTACYGYGYGIGFFNSNALLYIPAILMNAFDFSLTLAYKIFIFCCYIAVFWTFYYSAWKISNSKDAAFWSASMFLFATKVMSTIYLTIGVGQFTAMIFMPLVIAGIHVFAEKDEAPILLMIGFIGLMYTHVMSTFLGVVICFIICILEWKTIFLNKRKIVQLFIAVGIVTGVTSAFWLPMLEQMKAQTLKVKAPWTSSQENVKNWDIIFNNNHGIGYMVMGVGILSLIILMYKIWSKKVEDSNKVKGAFALLSIAFIITFLTTFYPFWYFMNSILGINIIQTPGRLHRVVTILILLAVAMVYQLVNLDVKKKNIFMFGILCIGILLAVIRYGEHWKDRDSEIPNEVVEGSIAGLGGGEEWLPINTDREKLQETEVATADNGKKVKGKKVNGFAKYVFNAQLEREYYEIPYIWYKGYKAKDAEGKSYEIDQNYTTGLVRVYMPNNGQMGIKEITVYYEGTKYQKISYIFSIIGIIMFALYVVYLNIMKNDKKYL